MSFIDLFWTPSPQPEYIDMDAPHLHHEVNSKWHIACEVTQFKILQKYLFVELYIFDLLISVDVIKIF